MRFSEDRIEKLTSSDGVLRDIHIWEPEKPKAVFLTVHGGMDHGGNYHTPGLYFKQHGFATVAHDQHGHDVKRKVHIPRFEVFLEDLELLLVWVKDNYSGLPIIILSHSMGGLIVTHFGIRRFKGDPLVKGFISSSPYYVNAIKSPWIVKKLAGLLSVLTPRMAVPIEDLLHLSTHDQEVYQSYLEEQKDGIMATKISARFGNEVLKAQKFVLQRISEWSHPMLVIFAGEDYYLDVEATRALVRQIDPELITELFYPENYHENFKELNREEVFVKMLEWAEPRIS